MLRFAHLAGGCSGVRSGRHGYGATEIDAGGEIVIGWRDIFIERDIQ